MKYMTKTTSTTTTAPAPPKLEDNDLKEMDHLIDEMMESLNDSSSPKKGEVNNTHLIVFALLVFIASLVLVVYVYTSVTRPRVHIKRNLVVPPSVRRRLRKGT